MKRSTRSDLTEEELMLQSKYAELKKTKQMLQEKLKTKTGKPSSNPVLQASNISVEAKAREAAEKLAKSGIIRIQQTTTRQEQGFKKPACLKKKLGSTEKSSISYQPFSAIENCRKDKPASKPKDETSDESSLNYKPVLKPIQSTIFIYGYKLSKELLEKHFTKFGKILQIKIETDEKAFITYKTSESAENAIREMHPFELDSIHYFQVSMSRYQPRFDNMKKWSHVAANFSRPRTQNLEEKENRKATVYDDNPFK